MQTLSGQFQIGRKAAKVLLAAMLGGLAVFSFCPPYWELVRTGGLLMMVFSAGMLSSQHAAIWEPDPTGSATPRP